MLEKVLLRQVAQTRNVHFVTKEDAEKDFLRAVTTYLRGKINVWEPEQLVYHTPPRFLLQIAVQVYAASQMANDSEGDFTENAYYVQLELLLGDLGARERFNTYDQGHYHQKLWRERLVEWAKSKGLLLDLPQDYQGAGRHVQLPKSQSVLRVSDLERLPQFFSYRGFTPIDGENPQEMTTQLNRLTKELKSLRTDTTCFTRWAREVLQDERKFPIAKQQIADALLNWDGSLMIRDAGVRSQRKPKSDLSVWLAIRTRPTRLCSFLGSNTTNLKPFNTDLLSDYTSGKPVMGANLISSDGITVFQFQEEYSAYQNCGTVQAGDRVLLLADPQAKRLLTQLLSCTDIVCDADIYSSFTSYGDEPLIGLPSGYRLANLRMARSFPSYDAIPEIWRPFLRKPRFGLTLFGGLRDSNNRWIQGAGPSLKIIGNNLPKTINIDGDSIAIANHVIQHERLSLSGPHKIIASADGNTITKQFEVVHPVSQPDPALPRKAWRFLDGQWPSFSNYKDDNAAPTANLYGVRCIGFEARSQAETQTPINDHLLAIKLLIRSRVDNQNRPDQSTIPLLQYLFRRSLTLSQREHL
jgi:hypothetical protein